MRAREYLERIESEMDARRKELGVQDELRQIDGLNGQMLVALGEDGIKSIEDFAGCAADDLVGWSERKDGETKKFEGLFSKFDVSRSEEHTSELQSLMRISYAVFCLTKKKSNTKNSTMLDI